MIIGCSGKARSGKGEFARIVVEEYGGINLTFAKTLKEEVKEFCKDAEIAFTEENFYGSNSDKEKLLNMSPRMYSNALSKVPEFEDYIEEYATTNRSSFTHYFQFTPRTLMQWWGTEYRRSQNINYWVNKTLGDLDPYKLYVIDDVRFKNEAQGVLDKGGVLVRIERSDRPEVSNPGHPSEVDLDDWGMWDAIIMNDQGLDHYISQIRVQMDLWTKHQWKY